MDALAALFSIPYKLRVPLAPQGEPVSATALNNPD